MSHRQENDGRGSFESEGSRLIAARGSSGLWLILGTVPIFLAVDLLTQPSDRWPALIAVKVVQTVVALGALHLLRGASELAAIQRIALAAACILMLGPAVAGTVRGDIATTVVLLVTFCMGTAGLLPWGAGRQIVGCLVAGTAMVANAMIVTGGITVVLGYQALGLAVALAGTVLIAHEHDRTRRDRTRMAGLLAGQTRVLEMVATGAPLVEILGQLARMIEARVHGMRCSVLLLEGDRLRLGAAPSLPDAYNAAIDGIVIGPRVGCCGTAAYTCRTVIARDTAIDPLWSEFRDLAREHGLRACWSAPILAGDGSCLGTFAMYYGEPRSPDVEERRLIDRAAHLAGVAIERRQTEDALACSRAQLEEESRVAGALATVGQALIGSLATPRVLDEICRMTVEILGCDCVGAALRDGEHEEYRVVAAHGYAREEWETLRHLHLPEALLGDLLQALARDGVFQLRTDAFDGGFDDDAFALRLLRKFGFTRTMYVPLRRGDAVIGILSIGLRARVERFTSLERRIAVGIAHLTSVALENARLVEELTRANQIKSEFVSTMSHELRTPLSVILGYTDVLRDDLQQREQQQTLDRIRSSGMELLDMIETTLDLNRLEAGKDPAQIAAVEVASLLDELAGEFAAVGARPDTVLRWDPPPPFTLWSDRRKLKIILKNLVGNALKFTPAGEVVVHCRREPTGCVFQVRDTGIGIDPTQKQHVFEMFRQADGSDSRSHGGVGLGLYITQRLVTLLGGEIRLESTLGRGTTFEVTVPDRAEAAAAPDAGAATG